MYNLRNQLLSPKVVPRNMVAFSDMQIHPESDSHESHPLGAAINDENENEDFIERKVWMGFVRKVFSILIVQHLVTLGILLFFMFPAEKFIKDDVIIISIAALISIMILRIWINGSEEAVKEAPLNYILLCISTIFEGLILSIISLPLPDDKMIVIAVGTTAVICFSLICFTFQKKWDFTGPGTFLFVILICLVFFAAFTVIFFCYPGSIELCLAALSLSIALLLSFHAIYVTQLMIEGKANYKISSNQYVTATLNIHLHIVKSYNQQLQL